MQWVHNLWNDDAGFIISSELVLVSTIVVIGLIVGFVEVRNQVAQELFDVSQAIGNLNQSYCFGGISKRGVAFVGGSVYIDVVDFCQQTACQFPFCPPPGFIFDAGFDCDAALPALDTEVGAVINRYY